MRLLHCVNSLNPATGGPAEFIRQEVTVLKSLGADIDVLSMDGPEAEWLRGFSTRAHAMGPRLSSYGYAPHFVPWLKQHRGEYDLIIVSGLWQFTTLGTWLALKNSSTPYVVFPHGMLDPWFNERYKLKHLKKIIYWSLFEHRVLRDASAVLFTTEEERVRARNSFRPYRCNEVVVGYGTNPPNGDLAAQRVTFLEAYPQFRRTKPILFLGRIHEKKGCDLLIEAFLQVRRKHPDLALVIAGPCASDYVERLKHYVSSKDQGEVPILFLDMLQGDLKWGALSAADALILPSHQENFGIVVAEALSCGTPVLISKRVNTWQEIVKDEAGLAEADDLAGTQRLLERWLGMSEAEKAAMRVSARDCFYRRFNLRDCFERQLAVLQRCIAG